MSSDQDIPLICKKRLLGEIKLLEKNPMDMIDIFPDEKDILTWYFLLKGPTDTPYVGGFYIGKILYTKDFPFKPPDFMMLTPNGRFDIGHKICLTNSGYHSEQWTPIWNMSTITMAFLSIMSDDTTHGLSHIRRTPEERIQMAQDSINYNMKNHSNIFIKFNRFIDDKGNPKLVADKTNTTAESVETMLSGKKKKKV